MKALPDARIRCGNPAKRLITRDLEFAPNVVIEEMVAAALRVWAEDQDNFFHMPNAAEGAFIGQIYGVAHFQQNIEQQKLLKGGRNADPFVIAKAAVEGRAVVTLEQFKANGAKIPNICRHFGVECFSLEEFMEREGWEF